MHKRHPELEQGTRIGSIEIIECLGKGASAHVYRVATSDGDEVALKIRSREGGELDPRFLREFESLRRLRFPGVVQVYEAGQDENWQWFTMEVVDGVPIRQWIEDAESVQERVKRACKVGADLFRSLSRIHAAGLVHRDIKPSNILVKENGAVRVLDFGVVGWWSVGIHLTSTGAAVGTLPFMAPEQMAGHRPTQAVDVFAAALCLYEGVVGKRARPPTPRGWVSRQMLQRLTPLAVKDAEIPRDFSGLVDRCLVHTPERRPTALETATALAAIGKRSSPHPWPEPTAFVARDAELNTLRRTTKGDGPRMVILSGPAGSGRRRLLEQLARYTLLEGQYLVRGICRQDSLGGAIGQILERIWQVFPAREWQVPLQEDDAQTLLAMWPWLPLQSASGQRQGVEVTREAVIQTTVRVLGQASQEERLVICVEELEDVDSLSARVLRRLAASENPELTLVCVLDPRWASDRSEDLKDSLLESNHALEITLDPLSPEDATQIARDLAPEADLQVDTACTPLEAVEQGLKALAGLRHERFPSIDGNAALLACTQEALPGAVLDAVVAPEKDLVMEGLVNRGSDGLYRMPGRVLRQMAEARLEDRADAHERWAAAWEHWSQGGARRWVGVAEHRVRADRTSMASWEAAVRASLALESQSQFEDARRWLMLLDTMPKDKTSSAYLQLRFSLSWCQTRIALACDTERIRRDLFQQAAQRALTQADRAEATRLQVQLLRREGKLRESVVKALRPAGLIRAEQPLVAARLLLDSVQSRLQLDQPSDGLASCAQVADILAEHPEASLEVELELAQAECLLQQEDFLEASRTSERMATKASYRELEIHRASGHLVRAECHLRLGNRSRAEELTRKAHRLVQLHGHRMREVQALLLQGELALGRGELGAARLNTGEAASMAKKLALVQQQRRALDLLRIALARNGAWTESEVVASQRAALGGSNPSSTWSDVAFWRLRRRPERAQAAASKGPLSGWYGALTRLELARAWMAAGEPAAASGALSAGEKLLKGKGFQELELLARLVQGVLDPKEDDSWALLVDECRQSRWLELFMGYGEFDARRALALRQLTHARHCIEALKIRAEELGDVDYTQTANELKIEMNQATR